MGRAERAKGVKGEREVAVIFEAAGLEVRGLEGVGDHVVVCSRHGGIALHSEVKRQEVARPWAWFEQAYAEAEPGSIPVVAFRRNRSPWLAIVELHHLARLAALAGGLPDPRDG